MKSINNAFSIQTIKLAGVAVGAALVAVFVVAPLLPDAQPETQQGLSLSALVAKAATLTETLGVCMANMTHNGCVTEDATNINAPFTGTYSLSARERRGADTKVECQGKEEYDLYINGTKVGRSTDPANCEPQGTFNNKSFGNVTLQKGSNTIRMVHAHIKQSKTAESVQATFTFKAPDPVDPPKCDAFDADPLTLPVGGGDTILSWETTGATSVTINNGVGPVSEDGNKTVSLTDTTTYTLTATNSGGKITCPVTVTVEAGDEPSITIIKRDAADKDDTQTIDQGGTAQFEIVVENTGTHNLIDVVVTDALASSCNGAFAQLNVGAVETYTCDSTNVQNSFTNIAKVEAASSVDDTVVKDNDSSDVIVRTPSTPSITIIKRDASDKDDTQTVAKGGTATFEIVVENTGSVDLKDVVVTDPLTPSCDKTIGSLLVSANDTYPCDAINVDASFTNVANVTGKSVVDDTEVQDSDDSAVVLETTTPAPSCTIDASPNTISSGDEVTITWTSTNADTATIDQGIGEVALNDATTTNPTVTTTYTMTVTGAGGTETCNDSVTIGSPTPSINIIKRDAVDQDDSQVLSSGAVAQFEIIVENTGDVDLKDVVVTDPQAPNCDRTIGSLAVAATSSYTCLREDVRVDFTNIADVTGKSVIDDTAVQDSDSSTVEVESGGGGGGGSSSSRPRCDVFEIQRELSNGDIVLHWETRRGRDMTIEPNVLTTSDDDLIEEGFATVTPRTNTRYTLTVERASREDTCTLDYKKESGVTVLQVRDQQPLTSISLTDIPYTGFEAGPFLTFLFYTVLVIWSIGVAYILIVKKGAVFGVTIPRSSTGVADGIAVDTNVLPHDEFVDRQAVQLADEQQTDFADAVIASTPAAPPVNLPVQVGYQQAVSEKDILRNEMNAEESHLEQHAHDHKALLSSDAIRLIIDHASDPKEQITLLDSVIERAKAAFPREDGWLVINRERINSILSEQTHVEPIAAERKNVEETAKVSSPATESKAVKSEMPAPAGVSQNHVQFVHAVMTGNVAKAYQSLGNNPSATMADAAEDLDAVYRSRKGERTNVPQELLDASASLTDEQLMGAITALTSALDGTYEDQSAAVRVAVIKAIRAMA